jgi:hypothetical protein
LPPHWPPRAGDLWTDRHGDAWFCHAPAPGQLFMTHQGDGRPSTITGTPMSLGSIWVRSRRLTETLVRLEWRKGGITDATQSAAAPAAPAAEEAAPGP